MQGGKEGGKVRKDGQLAETEVTTEKESKTRRKYFIVSTPICPSICLPLLLLRPLYC